jgi:hypothetical protein
MKFFMLMACAAAVLYAQEEGEVRFGTTVVLPSGLQGQIYHISKFAKQLPNFEKKKPSGTIYTTSLNIPTQDFHLGFPGVTKRNEWFAIDYTGRFWIEKPGRYKFILTSDDGAMLYIDDKPIIDNDGIHPTATKDGTEELTLGVHRIRVSYFQGPGFQLALILQVEPPGESPRIFDTNEFKPPSSVDLISHDK